MPHRPNKPCPYPGCRNLVKKGYCKDHEHFDTSKFRNQLNGVHPWYQTKFWKSLRAYKLKHNPLCEECETKGKLESANVVDHRTPWKTGHTEDQKWRLFNDYDNLRSLCTSCHNSKTGRENKKQTLNI
jgi:5-methylcytosine-specific restriction protein A